MGASPARFCILRVKKTARLLNQRSVKITMDVWNGPGGRFVVNISLEWPWPPKRRCIQKCGLTAKVANQGRKSRDLTGEWLRSRAPRGSTRGTPRETPENSTPEAHLRAQRKQKPLKHLNYFWARSDGRTEIPNEDHVFVKTAPDSLTRGQHWTFLGVCLDGFADGWTQRLRLGSG